MAFMLFAEGYLLLLALTALFWFLAAEELNVGRLKIHWRHLFPAAGWGFGMFYIFNHINDFLDLCVASGLQ